MKRQNGPAVVLFKIIHYWYVHQNFEREKITLPIMAKISLHLLNKQNVPGSQCFRTEECRPPPPPLIKLCFKVLWTEKQGGERKIKEKISIAEQTVFFRREQLLKIKKLMNHRFLFFEEITPHILTPTQLQSLKAKATLQFCLI